MKKTDKQDKKSKSQEVIQDFGMRGWKQSSILKPAAQFELAHLKSRSPKNPIWFQWAKFTQDAWCVAQANWNVFPLMLLASCVNTPIDISRFHLLALYTRVRPVWIRSVARGPSCKFEGINNNVQKESVLELSGITALETHTHTNTEG